MNSEVSTFALRRFMSEGVQMEWLQAYAANLEAHIDNVRVVGKQIGVDENRLHEHDLSKWSEFEFPHYARQFFGDRGDPVGWMRAWLHHQNHNDHHWEYWITRSGRKLEGDGVFNNLFQIPEAAIVEMVADWMGASKTYTGSWSIRKWYQENFFLQRIHPHSRIKVEALLEQFSYGEKFDG